MGNRIAAGRGDGIPNESDRDDDALLNDPGSGRSKVWDFITCKWNMSKRKQMCVLVSLFVLILVAIITPIIIHAHRSSPHHGNTTTSMPSSTTAITSTLSPEPTSSTESIPTTLSTEPTAETTEIPGTTGSPANSSSTEPSTTSTEITSSSGPSTTSTEATTTPGKHECKYDFGLSFFCPEGPFWGCWGKKSTRDEICKKNKWNKCFGKLVRPFPYYDCFCCSKHEWDYV